MGGLVTEILLKANSNTASVGFHSHTQTVLASHGLKTRRWTHRLDEILSELALSSQCLLFSSARLISTTWPGMRRGIGSWLRATPPL